MKTPIELNDAITAFVAIAQEKINAHFAAHLRGLPPDVLSFDFKASPRYVRIVETRDEGSRNPSRSVHSFIDTQTGDVLKAASWKAPAKHARGNIFADDKGAFALTPRGGIRYLLP